jgi:hypothetical protein
MRLAHLAHFAVAIALLFGFAAPAAAGKGGTLTTGGNTVAGPATFSLSTVGQTTVFSDTDSDADVCVTAINKSKSADVTVIVTGDATSNLPVPPGQTRVACVKNVATIEISCSDSCSVDWRADDY